MPLFHPRNQHHWSKDAHAARIYARYEIAYTSVDFGAALTFIIGSVMFFSDAWQTAGTWMFLVGSFLFAAKPSIRLARELQLMRKGDFEDLAERVNG